MKNNLLKLALEIVTSGQRDRFAENPVENIFEIAKQLAQHADHVIQESQDSLILQPASLDVATLKKRSGESLVIYNIKTMLLLLLLLVFEGIFLFLNRKY